MTDQQKKDFFKACRERNLQTIRELSSLFNINNIRNIYANFKPTPLVYSINVYAITDATELLLSLGAIPSPLDAYIILNKLGYFYHVKLQENFFKSQGYNLRKLEEIYRQRNKRLPPRSEKINYFNS